MSLLGRVIVIFFALIVAIMIAGIALVIGIIAPDWTGVDSDPVERVGFFIVSFFATSFVGAVAIFPALIVIVIAEAARMRSFIYYGVGGALVGHALQLAAAAGIIGGLAYWLIAGRNAGRWREPHNS